ncbi:MAG: nitrile hydratase subunit beta [Deltaproteobacteria bacterium]|nr:nitrile hydratase subunit beta [Deltaproteobacteria bacterium]
MHGIHDLGGMHGFGRVEVEADEPVFHAAFERRVLGMAYQVVGFGWITIDAFRHGIERIPPVDYLTLGYYGRWRAALERLLIERGVLASDEVDARVASRTSAPPAAAPAPPAAIAPGFERDLARPARFAGGDRVRARVTSSPGHTRLPRYVAGRVGTVVVAGPAYVFPDANAHGRGEDPQHLYTVRFDGRELWGDAAEPATSVHVDLFEPYLEPVP